MKEVTPTDGLGIPFPIVGKLSDKPKENNWHHHWHPKKDMPRPHRRVLRGCRKQRVAYWDHDDYHAHFLGPELPPDPRSRFGAVLLCAAGYVPEQGISFYGDTHSIVELSRTVRRRMWTGGDLTTPFSTVRPYIVSELQKYIPEMNFPETQVDEFLYSDDIDTRIRIAKSFYAIAARHATDPIRVEYVKAWQEGRLPRDVRRPDTRLSVPKMPEKTVVNHVVFGTMDRTGILNSVEDALVA